MKGLKQKAVSGVKWMMIVKITQKMSSVVTFAILARILEPSVFGLFAMAFILIDGLGIFQSFGIDSGLIQRKDSRDIANHTAFSVILFFGVVVFSLCMLLAPLAGKFFGNPEVTVVVQALGIIFVINSFGKVPSALLTRRMKFRTISFIRLASSFVNSICAISFALISPTIWSLVWAYIIKGVVMVILLFFSSGYRVKFQYEKKAAKELFSFGKFIVGLSILSYVMDNMNNIVVGKMLGTTILGYFALASNIGNFINSHFTQLISRVMFPAYAAIQNNLATVRKTFLKIVSFISCLSFPFSFFIILAAEEIVLTIYGAKWVPMIPLMQLFGIVQIISPLGASSWPIFMGCGKPDYQFRLNLARVIFRLPVLIGFAYVWGAEGAVYAMILTSLIFVPINLYLVKRIVDYRLRELVIRIKSTFIACVAMSSIIVLSKYGMGQMNVMRELYALKLAILSAVGGSVYLLTLYWADRTLVQEIIDMLFRHQPKTKKKDDIQQTYEYSNELQSDHV
ncbi:MAG: lipopolysaccharide biosynthesis protein [Candidatus Omnitrophica bacterium]|nr:lipopolysaccharide biosynthesis protein [Candidatus Omnitrophota bacterium]